MRALRFALRLLGALLACVALYAGFTWWRYNRVAPAEHRCIGCTTPVTVNGYALFYRERGTDQGRPPVILVHGGPGQSSLTFKDGFDFVAAHTRLVTYDQRGSGNSESKARPGDYTVEALVEELETLRRDVVRAERVVLVGHSFGSAIVQRYAVKYPGHVDRMVLVGGVRINNGMPSHFVWQWLGPMFYSFAIGLPPGGARAADAWWGALSSSDRLFDSTRTDLLRDTGPSSFAAWREISLSVTGRDYAAELRQLQVPTLFMYGAADSPFTGKPVADELCALLPHCVAVGFEHSGHWPFLEEPLGFQRALLDFLGTAPAAHPAGR